MLDYGGNPAVFSAFSLRCAHTFAWTRCIPHLWLQKRNLMNVWEVFVSDPMRGVPASLNQQKFPEYTDSCFEPGQFYAHQTFSARSMLCSPCLFSMCKCVFLAQIVSPKVLQEVVVLFTDLKTSDRRQSVSPVQTTGPKS